MKMTEKDVSDLRKLRRKWRNFISAREDKVFELETSDKRWICMIDRERMLHGIFKRLEKYIGHYEYN